MKSGRFLLIFIAPLVLTTLVKAWGYEGHRRINHCAAQVLSGPLGQFLRQNDAALTWYGPVPDYEKGSDPNEFYRHFIDLDNYDEFPFKAIPMDYDSLIQRYGENQIREWGIGPWAIQQTCDRLINLLKQKRFDEAVFVMGVLGHYVADLHMPLHTVRNYNGQYSGNTGVHFRWEDRLVHEYVKEIIPQGDIPKIGDPLVFAFDIARESFSVYTQILTADAHARSLLTAEQAQQLNSYHPLPFEKPYLDRLYAETGGLLQERLGLAVNRIAAYWLYCWEAAGSPELPD